MKEEEIRPESLFNDYLALAENDVKTFFLSSPFRYVPCPACGATERWTGSGKWDLITRNAMHAERYMSTRVPRWKHSSVITAIPFR